MSLSTRAMLVSVSISQWTASKKDKTVSEAIQTQAGADKKKSGWFNKRLIDPKHLEPFTQLDSKIAAYLDKNTQVWSGKGMRILPSELFMDFTAAMRGFRAEMDKLKADFVPNYPQYVSEARTMLGNMYDPNDYPAVSSIADRFGITIDFAPVPEAGDFRVDLGNEAVEEIRASITQMVADREQQMVKNCWAQLREVVEKLEERLADPKAVFRDTLFGNIEDRLAMIPAFNINKDAALSAMCDRVRYELVQSPDAVRRSKKLRAEVCEAARRILQDMPS